MKNIYSKIIPITIVGFLLASCGGVTGMSGDVLTNFENGTLSKSELKQIKATDEQIKTVRQQVNETLGPESQQSIKEVMSPAPSAIDESKLYLCKTEPIEEVVHHHEYVRVGDGGYLQSKCGKVRTGTGGHSEHVHEKPGVPKYMICYFMRSGQNVGTSLCLPKEEIESYVRNTIEMGGRAHMGPCK